MSSLAINDEMGAISVAYFETFGKGKHVARLNLGDCLSYACTKAPHAPLLFKVEDFSKTDIATAAI